MSRIIPSWAGLPDKPSIGDLAGVLPLDKLPAHSHSWNDLTGLLPLDKLPAHTHSWSDLSGLLPLDKLPAHTHDDRYARLSGGNTLSGNQVVNGNITASGSVTSQQTGFSNAFVWGAGSYYARADGLLSYPYWHSAGSNTVLTNGSLRVRNAADTADAGITTSQVVASAGTATASSPILDLSQTWNNAAIPFTAVQVNITATQSAMQSRLFDFRVGGSTLVCAFARYDSSVQGPSIHAGSAFIGTANGGHAAFGINNSTGNCFAWLNNAGLGIPGSRYIGFGSTNDAMRDTSSAWVDTRMSRGSSAGTVQVGTAANAVGGSLRLASIGNATVTQTFDASQFLFSHRLNVTGQILCSNIVLNNGTNCTISSGTTNLVDIFRNDGSTYAGLRAASVGNATATAFEFPVGFAGATFSPGGVDALLRFGGTLSSQVALRRNGQTLQVRLADDSAFGNFQAAAISGTSNLTLDRLTNGLGETHRIIQFADNGINRSWLGYEAFTGRQHLGFGNSVYSTADSMFWLAADGSMNFRNAAAFNNPAVFTVTPSGNLTATGAVSSRPRSATVSPNVTDIPSGFSVWWHDTVGNGRRYAYNDGGLIFQSPLLKSSIPATPSDLAGVISVLQHWGLCA